jgi:hypothetical protein
MWLLKIAVRVIETAARAHMTFAAACPEAALFETSRAAFVTHRERQGFAPRPNPVNPKAC